MIGNELIDLQQQLQRRGILISFSGWMTQGLIEEYGEAVKAYLESEERPKTQVFNVFSIFIEQTQNIKNYCTSKQSSAYFERISHSCIVTIGRNDDGYSICSGNLVELEDIEPLKAHIDSLIPLDKNELKKTYKVALSQEWSDGQAGAGVGLIDIARKSSQPLAYSVVPVDDRLSFFTIKAVV